MIYLFSNRTYGAPFQDAAARYVRTHGTPITAVFSGNRHRERETGPVGALRSLAARWRAGRTPAAGGLPLLIVDDVNAPSFYESVQHQDVGIIAGFDQIFKQPAIARFRSFVNLHPSLLPYYRGPEPSFWCIDNGETVSGFTIHTVTTKIDSGEIHHQESLIVDSEDDAASLTMRIAALAIPAFERWLDHVTHGVPWNKTTLDAAALYSHHVDYRSFHEAAGSRQK